MALKFNPLTAQLDLVGDSASGGDVFGPSSSTDNAIARYDGTTGKLIQNSKSFVQDGGAVEAIAYISNTTIDDLISVDNNKVMISSAIDVVPGGVINLGAGSKLIIL